MKNNIISLITVIGSVFVIFLYTLGFSFYLGYAEGMGFKPSFFPLDGWDSAIIWAYFACVYIFIDVFKILVHLNPILFFPIILIILSIMGLYFRVSLKREYISARLHSWLLLKKERYPFIGKLSNPKVQESIRVVETSNNYFLGIPATILFVIIILIMIPVKTKKYGQSIGIEQAQQFLESENLCEDSNEFWNPCITVLTSHLKGENLPAKIEGRLIAKSETMLGIFTKDGPITMSMPKYIYYKSTKNECFDNGCKDKVTGDGNSLSSNHNDTDL